MSRYRYNQHPFDMNEYLSGERFVVGGMICDWEEPEEKPIVVQQIKIEKDVDKNETSKVRKTKKPS